ncbi:hypothetical protein [Clavibacter zhangzhiyongii]|uniref:hypothetical protein n=1 Tax=Clavibacter zhangzhiyongii TaxID=2768071 RepID=UPI0039E06E80
MSAGPAVDARDAAAVIPATPSTGPTACPASLRAVLAALGPGAVAHADLDARLRADVDLPADADVHGLRPLDDGIPAHGR